MNWKKIAKKFESELRMFSDDELNNKVIFFSGLPFQNFLTESGAFILLLQDKKVFSLLQYNDGTFLNPGPRKWECRFGAPEWCCVKDKNLSMSIVLAYLVGKLLGEEAKRIRKKLWGDNPPWHATIEIDMYCTTLNK